MNLDLYKAMPIYLLLQILPLVFRGGDETPCLLYLYFKKVICGLKFSGIPYTTLKIEIKKFKDLYEACLKRIELLAKLLLVKYFL